MRLHSRPLAAIHQQRCDDTSVLGHVMGTLLMPVTMDDLSTPNATVTGERGRGKGMLCVARGSGLRHAVAPTRTAIRLSPTACKNLLGILLHHPSRTAAVVQSQRVDELAITLQKHNMNLETRQAWKYVSLRLPGLWPLMSPSPSWPMADDPAQSL